MHMNSELHQAVGESSLSRPPFVSAGAVSDWFDAESVPSYLLHSAAAMSDPVRRVEVEFDA
ncbi:MULTISPECIES: hypothetical protein [Subtercola]|uniref:hypothetical protein n=1 Tax=Subtercola TaxID=120212 RepID=UPI0010AA4A81|nr:MULTISPECIES: hypothetical protein [Subtercola]MEA9983996.1 hypothetical protein [Subtercola sp. RTI3]